MEYHYPVEVPSRILLIQERAGRLLLQTPIARNWKVAMVFLVVFLVLSAFLHGFNIVATDVKAAINLPWSDFLDKRPWLDFLLDLLLPSPIWEVNLVALAVAAIAVALVGHRILTAVDHKGITIIHSLYGLNYWQITVPRQTILSFDLKVNARWGNGMTLYALVVNIGEPPSVRSCGHDVTPTRYKGQAGWQEWMAADLPEDVAAYVLGRVQAVCGCPSTATAIP